MSRFRRRESRKGRRHSFGKNARRTHKKNIGRQPMRGGVRL
ncbi:MAG: hypothetical protein [Microvirus sp.]|nr:MAG: hypothetical protein [Microvirus sp.]